MTARAVVVEADGGSRGNPGPAAYGAVMRDATTSEVIAEVGATIGVATNNVAEYQGLIAGLRLVAEFAPGASVEVRMDSKLVVEQMSGRWRIKHPSMRPLAEEASALAPSGTTYTWIPRERNQHADRLVNQALDGEPTTALPQAEAPAEAPKPADRGWARSSGPATTLVLVRHGATVHTAAKRLSGGHGGDDPVLTAEGRAQVAAVGQWLAPLAGRAHALLASPMRRTVESAEILAGPLGCEPMIEESVVEIGFGEWEGLTFGEVFERWPERAAAWLRDVEQPAGGSGESFAELRRRVLAGRDRIVAEHAGETVVVVSHVTPIKTLVADAMGAPLEALHRMELGPASVCVVAYHPDPAGLRGSLRLFNGGPLAPWG